MTEWIKCKKCGWKSHNPNDIKNKYCGHCHEFHKSHDDYEIGSDDDVVTYCEYCKKQTRHKRRGKNDLQCRECGSTRLWKIQGFDASLM